MHALGHIVVRRYKDPLVKVQVGPLVVLDGGSDPNESCCQSCAQAAKTSTAWIFSGLPLQSLKLSGLSDTGRSTSTSWLEDAAMISRPVKGLSRQCCLA